MDHEPEAGLGHRLHRLIEVAVVVHTDRRRMWIRPSRVDNHVDLVGGDAPFGHRSDLVEDLGCRVVVVVDDALGGVEVEHAVEVVGGHGGRVEVGHAEDGRVSACGCLAGAGDQVFFVGVSRFPGVDVHVHTAGYGDQSGGVDHLGIGRSSPSGNEAGDGLSVDHDVERPELAFDEYVCAGDESGHGCSLRVVIPVAV